MKNKSIFLAISLLLLSNQAFAGTPPKSTKLTNSNFQQAGKKKFKVKIQRDVAMADELMLKGKYKEASDLYRQAINRNSKDVYAVTGLGMALAKQFKLDAAEEQFDKALAMDDKNATAHCGKAIVLMNRLQSSSLTIQRQRDSILKQAEAECQSALNIDSQMPEAHYTLGLNYREQGKLDEAANQFQQAIDSDSKYAEAYAGLGLTQLDQGKNEDAEVNFQKALSMNSGNSTAHYGLGKSYVRQGRYDDAIKELNTALYQNPNSAPTHLALGECYENQGNSVAAVKEYQESIRIKAENPEAYSHIADIRDQRGDTELAISELRSGLELMPDNMALRMRIGDSCLKLDKLDDAIKEYTQVLSQQPQNSQAAQGLTRCYYLKAQKETNSSFMLSNEYENAERMIDQAIAMNPNDMELRLAQAKIRSLSGKQVDLNSIGQPRSDGERIAYAEALLAQNKFNEATEQMNIVLNNAQNPKQAFAIADLALMIKDLPSAENAYRKAGSVAGNEERAKRGMDQVAKAKEVARQDLTLADDLARKKQLASAIDKYHASIYENPKVPDARKALAQTLERLSPALSRDYRQAIVQWKAYLSLSNNLPAKEVEKINKHIESLDKKAFKLEQKEAKQKAKRGS